MTYSTAWKPSSVKPRVEKPEALQPSASNCAMRVEFLSVRSSADLSSGHESMCGSML